MLLSTREKEELHKAIYEYLATVGYEKSAETFANEVGDQVMKQQEGGIKNILERKWVTIHRLQKQIIELEMEVGNLTEELKSVSKGRRNIANNEDTENLFPKPPAAHVFTGHKGVVTKVVMHPMFMQMASIGDDEAIKLWDYESKRYEGALKGHTEKINDISFDPSGAYIASCSSDMLIKVWDLEAKTCIKTFTGHDHTVSCVRWKNTSDFVLSASRDETIKLWELATGYCVRTYKGHEKWIRMVDFNIPCTKFVSCSDDNSLRIYELNKEQCINELYGHSHVVECVMFVNSDQGKKTINEAKYNPEGKAAIEGNMTEIEKSKLKLQEGGKTEDYSLLEFIISGSRDKSIRIWSGQTGNTLLIIEGHSNWVRGLAMHHSNKYFYSCSEDKSIKVWNLSTGKIQSKIEDAHSHFVTDIAAHPAYLYVATSSIDHTVKLWECK